MGTKWLARSAATGLAAGLLALAGTTAARANSTIAINPGNVPTTAKAYTQNCDANFGGGPYADQDVWVFNLPGNPRTSGHFLSVTASFLGHGSKTITADGGAIVQNGTSKAWIKLPAGWTLTGATATISGTADFFVLTHTCAAKGSPSPSPSASHSHSPSPRPTCTPSKPGSGSPSPGSPSPSASTSTTASPTTSPGTGGGVSPTGSPPSSSGGGSLPITGAPLALTVLLGGTLLAAGASATVLARRRRQQHGA
jgi:hypothetical protein